MIQGVQEMLRTLRTQRSVCTDRVRDSGSSIIHIVDLNFYINNMC
jgi:hypothetical protein